MIKLNELIVYETIDEGDEDGTTSRIEYKNRVIQMYTHGNRICFFVMKEDGNDDKEFFCLKQAVQYIDEVTK